MNTYEQTVRVLGIIKKGFRPTSKFRKTKEYEKDKLRRKIEVDPNTISIHLSAAKLCLNCDKIYSGPFCPACLCEAHDPVKKRYANNDGTYLINTPIQ